MKNSKVKRMTFIGLLMAMVVVMQFITASIPPVSGFSISLVLIPIVVGSALFGVGAGAILGATFGVIVAINCITGADAVGQMVFQANPVLCILVVLGKGVLAGAASGAVYRLIKRFNAYAAMLAAAIICPVVNTGVFVACMLTFFPEVLSAWAQGGDLIAYILSGLLLLNFVPELIINVVFSPFGNQLVRYAQKKL